MNRAIFALAPLVTFALVAACSSSSDDPGSKKDTSATETPPGTPGTSGAGTSGTSGAGTSGTSGGGTSGTSGTSGTTGATDAGGDAPAANCVPKGYAGNEKKIGAYCDKNTPCPFQLDPFLVCTEGHDPTNSHLFCTAPCSKDSECGTNAFCVHDPAGSGCVPKVCGGAPN